MEEVYIVKMKNLPMPTPSDEELASDGKGGGGGGTSFYYQNDLTAEALRGFGFLHIFFGFTLLCLSVTNLCFNDNPLALEPPLGLTVWCSIAYILLGLFTMLTGFKRKCDLPASIIYVKVLLAFIMLTLSLTFSFLILFLCDLHGPISNQLIGLNMLFSIVAEVIILLLSVFTTARILWPNFMSGCAPEWPMQQTLKRKTIVKTNVFTNGIQQDDNGVIQAVGPNCVISLNLPPVTTTTPTTTTATSSDSESQGSPRSDYSSISASDCPVPRSLRGRSSSLYYGKQQPGDCQPQVSTIYHGRSFDAAFGDHTGGGRKTTMTTLQTFPSGETSTGLGTYSNLNRLLCRFPMSTNAIYREDEESGGRCNPTFFGDDIEEEVAEEENPYDTDEFDYCSTEDDDAGAEVVAPASPPPSPPVVVDEEEESLPSVTTSSKHATSSDEGNVSGDEDKSVDDTKSSVDDLSQGKTDTTSSSVLSITITKPQEGGGGAGGGAGGGVGGVAVDEDRKSNTSEENLSLHDEGIGHSSGSSTCSGEDAYHLLTSSTTTTIVGAPTKEPPIVDEIKISTTPTYKSSITIGGGDQFDSSAPAPPLPKTLPPPPSGDSVASKVTLFSSTLPAKKKASFLASTNAGDSSKETASATPTIRFLTTTKSSLKHKQLADTQGPEIKTTERPSTPLTITPLNGKLASHPYLCRLRSNPSENVERRYPKYVGQVVTPPSLSLGPSTDSVETSTSRAKVSSTHLPRVNHQQGRVPDIERV